MDGGATYEDAEESRGNFPEKRTGLTAFLGWHPVFSCFSAAFLVWKTNFHAIFFENRDIFVQYLGHASASEAVEVDRPNQLVQPFHIRLVSQNEGRGAKISHKKMANCCFVIFNKKVSHVFQPSSLIFYTSLLCVTWNLQGKSSPKTYMLMGKNNKPTTWDIIQKTLLYIKEW